MLQGGAQSGGKAQERLACAWLGKEVEKGTTATGKGAGSGAKQEQNQNLDLGGGSRTSRRLGRRFFNIGDGWGER